MSRVLCRAVVTLRLKGPLARSMSAYLIDDPKYAFLEDLGLEKKNIGVFNGKWEANGQVWYLVIIRGNAYFLLILSVIVYATKYSKHIFFSLINKYVLYF